MPAHPRIPHDEFRALYVRLRPELEAQARRFLWRPQEIEDVVQETLLRLYQAAVDVDSEVQAFAYAHRVLTNLCIDRFRAAGRRPAVVSLEDASAHQLADIRQDTDLIVQAEDASVVREALAQLSPEYRAALIKREVEEKPLTVIAAELGIPVESVKHLLFRARRSLRRLLIGTQVEPGVEIGPIDHVRPSAGASTAGAVLVSTLALVMTLGGVALPIRSATDRTAPVAASGYALYQHRMWANHPKM